MAAGVATMADITVVADGVDVESFENPVLVEGLPGVGLVGKIAADHLVDHFEMTHYGNVHCDDVPKVAAYGGGDSTLRTPVRVYADSERSLLVLQSDVPLSPHAGTQMADCLHEWFTDAGVFPIYLSGVPEEKTDEVPAVYGVGTGAGTDRLRDADVPAPDEAGLVSGPTGALLDHAVESGYDAAGLVVESDPRFPDPEAARSLIKNGIEPLSDVEVPVDDLVDRAEEIREAKEKLAKRMQEADEESTQAQPLRMYQ